MSGNKIGIGIKKPSHRPDCHLEGIRYGWFIKVGISERFLLLFLF